MTEEPVVSSAIASTWSPEIPAFFTASRVAAASARMWSWCDWVAYSGSSRLRCRGYSARAESSNPRSLSTMETRTLRVPKSTPATIAISRPCYRPGADTCPSPCTAWLLRKQPATRSIGWRRRGAQSRFRRSNAEVFATQVFPRRPRRRRYTAHLARGVIGGEAGKAHLLRLDQPHAGAESIFLAYGSGNNLREIHFHRAEEM